MVARPMPSTQHAKSRCQAPGPRPMAPGQCICPAAKTLTLMNGLPWAFGRGPGA
jgi:hypothetical protein